MYELAIVGGGVNGLSALFHALRLGVKRAVLFEQHTLGHDRGSSHGAVRITRSTYPDPVYVELMKRVLAVEWPELEAALSKKLIHPRPGVLFGPEEGPFGDYVDAVQKAQAHVELLTPNRAQEGFPFLNTKGSVVVLDRTAGIVDARATCQGLANWCEAAGAELRSPCRILELTPRSSGAVSLKTDSGSVEAERVIVTAGAWTHRLLSDALSPEDLTVIRQTVGYYHIDDAPEVRSDGPVWAYVGQGDNEALYGLHERGTDHVKMAQHVTVGPSDDPDEEPLEDRAEDLDGLVARIRGPARRVSLDYCLYTLTPTSDFILAPHPRFSSVVVGAGFSGHGFKLAPLCGRILAELALSGASSVEAYRSGLQKLSWPAPAD